MLQISFVASPGVRFFDQFTQSVPCNAGADNNLDGSGPGTNHGSADQFQVDNPFNIIGNIIAGSLDNTDHIGAGPDNVSMALLYSFAGFGADQQLLATFGLSDFENGGLRQFRGDSTQLFFNGIALETNLPAPTPEPGTLILLGTGAAATMVRKLHRRFRSGNGDKIESLADSGSALTE